MTKPPNDSANFRFHLTETYAAWIGACLLAVSGCSSAPRVPDWQMEAKSSIDRAVQAYLEGNERVEAAEMVRARKHIASSGRADLLADIEMLACAARVASLVYAPCVRFEALRPDATQSQRAYADHLRGQSTASSIPLLPTPQRVAASRAANDAAALQGIEDPLSLLVAAGVLLNADKASPAVIEQAVTTASAQGWRRPLLAWLSIQVERATQAGRFDEEARLRRRMEIIYGTGQETK